MKLCKELPYDSEVNNENDDVEHRNGYSPDVTTFLPSNDCNIDGNFRPSRERRKPLRFNDYVCSLFVRSVHPSRRRKSIPLPTPPTHRPCVYCGRLIGSRNLFHRHVQYDHRDILAAKRETRRNVPYQMTEIQTQTILTEPKTTVAPVVFELSTERVVREDANSDSVNLCEEVVHADSAPSLESR